MKTIPVGKICFSAAPEHEDVLQKNYSNNLRALRASRPELALGLEAEKNDIQRFTLLNQKGNLLIFYAAADNPHVYKIEKKENITLDDSYKNLWCNQKLAFTNVFPGNFLLSLKEIPLPELVVAAHLESRAPIYILERSMDRFRAMTCLYDLNDVFLDPRFVFFVGENCLSRFEAHLLHGQSLPPEFPPVAQEPGLYNEARKIIDKTNTAQMEVIRDLVQELQSYYDAFNFEQWAARFNNKPLRILIIASRFSNVIKYTASDLSDGFSELGHTVEIHSEESNIFEITSLSILIHIHRIRPDIILIMSRIRPESPWLPSTIPFVTYLQDIMFATTNSEYVKKLSHHDIIVAGDYIYNGKSLLKYGYPAANIHDIPFLVTNTKKYKLPVLSKEDMQKYFCDVAFVSNHSQPVHELFNDLKKNILANIQDETASPVINTILDSIYEQIENRYIRGDMLWSEFQFEEMLRVLLAEREVNLTPLKPLIVSYLWGYIGGNFLRHRILRWVEKMDVNFKLYGAGWERNPEFSKYSCGVAQYGEEVCKIFNLSKINLHIDFSALHFRLCDGFASGGFFLLNYTPMCELPQKAPEIQRLFKNIHKPITVNEIVSRCEDTVASELVRFILYTNLHKAGNDIVGTEEIKLLLDVTLPDDYVRFTEFISYQNLKELYYRDEKEFSEKARYFLSHEKERKKITEMAHRFMRNYTYSHLCGNFINIAARHFGNLAVTEKHGDASQCKKTTKV